MDNNIDARRRIWLGILYPESSKENWIDLLRDMCICCAISPLHDRDVNEDGELKKPHFHLVMKWEGSKSFKQVWDMLRNLAVDPNHCPPPEVPWSDTKTVYNI